MTKKYGLSLTLIVFLFLVFAVFWGVRYAAYPKVCIPPQRIAVNLLKDSFLKQTVKELGCKEISYFVISVHAHRPVYQLILVSNKSSLEDKYFIKNKNTAVVDPRKKTEWLMKILTSAGYKEIHGDSKLLSKIISDDKGGMATIFFLAEYVVVEMSPFMMKDLSHDALKNKVIMDLYGDMKGNNL